MHSFNQRASAARTGELRLLVPAGPAPCSSSSYPLPGAPACP
jgi:hypothetical protein